MFNICYGDNSSDVGDYLTHQVVLGNVSIDAGALTMGLATHTADGKKLQNDGHGLLGIGCRIDETITQIEGTNAVPVAIYDVLVELAVTNRAAYSLYLTSDTGSVLFGGIDTTSIREISSACLCSPLEWCDK